MDWQVSIRRKVDMRAHRTFLSFALATACGITLQSSAFSQEYRGTWEQQRACTPDVWRICGAQIPDVERIVACLRRKLRTSAIGAARFLQNATFPQAVRIATTGKGVTIEIMDHVATIVNMGQGPMTETSGRGRTMAQGLTRISTTKYR